VPPVKIRVAIHNFRLIFYVISEHEKFTTKIHLKEI
jgi:hypothetical protein